MNEEWVVLPNGGSIRLVGFYGSDALLAEVARNSVGGAAVLKKKSTDRALIRRLVRDLHTSPLEFGQMHFQVVTSIMVERQHVRHRMESYSVRSDRYTKRPTGETSADGFPVRIKSYPIRKQSAVNRQMSDGLVDDEVSNEFIRRLLEHSTKGLELYHDMIEGGAAREQARQALSLDSSSVYHFTVDTWNLMQFLRLRLAPDAQLEIREMAGEMHKHFKAHFPILAEAFEDYILLAVRFSRMEHEVLKDMAHLLRRDPATLDALRKSVMRNLDEGTASVTERRHLLETLGLEDALSDLL